MKILFIILITFFLVILQVSVLPYLEVYGATPNLILILVLIVSILGEAGSRKEEKRNLVWALFGGVFLDLFSFNKFFGISILTLVIISFLTRVAFRNFFKKPNILTITVIAVLGTALYNLALAIFDPTNFYFLFSRTIYNVVVMVPLFYVVKSFYQIYAK